ncbi:MAG: YjgN family protein, partial [Cellvibrionaceae bacterium]|nr:YjgN family protein [Cellvibrionaceae bacterium]
APLLPYLITSAFRFRRRHTSYRNIRFGFDGNTWAATKAFGAIIVASALIIGTLFSLVFALPEDGSSIGGLAIAAMVMVFFFVLFIAFLPALFIQAVQQFSISYSRFGSLKFNGSIGIRETVLAYFLAGLYTNLILLGAALLFGTATWVNSALSIAFLVLSGLVIGFAYAFGVAYWKQAILTIVFRHLRLANIQFRASISTTKLAYILLINALLMTLTLGFYYPWAKVRLVRYLLSCIQLKGELPSAEEADPHSSHAIGEEMGEAFDIDIGV